jgi:aspartate beta-hydroxylase
MAISTEKIKRVKTKPPTRIISRPKSKPFLKDEFAELKRCRADLVSYGRATLERHLLETVESLKSWNQPTRVVLAGLFYNGYSTDQNSHRLFSITDRNHLRDLIGPEAENLVYLFCSINRSDFFNSLRAVRGLLKETFYLPDRWSSKKITIDPRSAGDLLVLYMASVLEQACLSSGEPALCLADLSEFAQWARFLAEVPPTPLDHGRLAVSKEKEEQLLSVYAKALERLQEDSAAVLAQLASAVLPNPWVGEPFLWMGFLALAEGDRSFAAQYAARAKSLLSGWGAAWDKRLSLSQWLELCGRLEAYSCLQDGEFDFVKNQIKLLLPQTQGSPERLYLQLQNRFAFSEKPSRSAGEKTPISNGFEGEIVPVRFQRYLSMLRTNQRSNGLKFYPGLSAKPWHDAPSLSLVQALEKAAPQIIKEFQNLDMRQFRDEAESIQRTGRWSVLFLFERGKKFEEACALSPTLTSILEERRVVKSSAGSVYFSCLDPATRVDKHRGPTNMRLRCHLGIEIPEKCGLKVGGLRGGWQAQKCVVFDDSFVHEVWNESDQRRVVLIIDVWHPDLSDEEIELLEGLQRHNPPRAGFGSKEKQSAASKQ